MRFSLEKCSAKLFFSSCFEAIAPSRFCGDYNHMKFSILKLAYEVFPTVVTSSWRAIRVSKAPPVGYYSQIMSFPQIKMFVFKCDEKFESRVQ